MKHDFYHLSDINTPKDTKELLDQVTFRTLFTAKWLKRTIKELSVFKHFAITILDESDHIMMHTDVNDYCRLVRSTPEGRTHCRTTLVRGKESSSSPFRFNPCPCYLNNCIIPLTINQKTIGSLVIGQIKINSYPDKDILAVAKYINVDPETLCIKYRAIEPISPEIITIGQKVIPTLVQKLVDSAVQEYLFKMRRKLHNQPLSLDEKESIFNALFSKTSLGLLIRKDFKYVDCNHKFRQTLGVTPDEVSLMDLDSSLGEQDQKQVLEAYNEVLHGTKDHYTFINQIKNIKGEALWHEVTFYPIFYHGEDMIMTSYRNIDQEIRAKKQLGESKAFLQTLINTGQAYISVLDTQGKITYINERVMQLFGCKNKEDMLGHHISEFQLVNNRLYLRMLDKILIDHQRIKFDDYGGINKEGKVVWIETILNPYFDQNHNFIGVIDYTIDISERKSSELSSIKQEQIIRSILNSGSTYTLMLDENGVINYANQATIEIFNWPEDNYKNSFQNMISPLTQGKNEATIQLILDHVKSMTQDSIEAKIERQGGEHLWIKLFFTPLKNDAQENMGLIIQAINIHEIKAREIQLQISEQNYKELANAGNMMIFAYDQHKQYTFVNDNAVKFIGKTRDEIIGQDASLYFHDKVMLQIFYEKFDQHQDFTLETQVSNSRNEIRWMLIVYTVKHTLEGQFMGYIVQTHDITVSKLLTFEVEHINALNKELVNSGNINIYTTDIHFNILFANETIQHSLAQNEKNIIKHQLKETLHPSDSARFKTFLTQIKNDHEYKNHTIEQRWRMYDKRSKQYTYRWVESTFIPRFDEHHHHLGYIVKTIDIHDLKVTKQKIDDQRKYFIRLLNSGETFAYNTEANGTVVYANQPMLKFLGIGMDNLGLEFDLIRFIPREESDDYYHFTTHLLKIKKTSHQPKTITYQSHLLCHEDQKYYWFKFYITPEYNEESLYPQGFIVQAINVDEQINNEEILRSSQEFFSVYYNNIKDIIFSLNTDGVIIDVNPALSEITNNEIKPNDFVGIKLIETDIVDNQVLIENFFNELHTTGSFENPASRLKLGRKEYIFSVYVKAVYNSEGVNSHYVGVLHNVTQNLKMQHELKEQQLLYSSVMDMLPISIYRAEKDSRFVFVNKTFCQQFGVTNPQEIVGQTIMEACAILKKQHQENGYPQAILSLDEIPNYYLQVTLSGETQQKTLQLTNSKGNISFLNSIQSPVHDMKGKIIGVQGILLDITKQMVSIQKINSTNRALRKVNERAMFATSLFKLAPMGYTVTNNDQQIIDINDAACALLEEKKENILMKSFLYLWRNTSDMMKPLKIFNNLIQHPNQTFRYQGIFIKSNGEKVYYSIEHFYSSKSQVLLSSFSDITSLKQAEERIGKQNQTIQQIFDISPDGIMLITKDGSIQQISSSAQNLLFLTQSRPLKQSICQLLPRYKTEIQQLINDALVADFPTTEEITIYNPKDENDFFVLEFSVKAVDVQDKALIIINIRNVTDRKQLTEMMISNERLVSLGQMATAMAHEINQPLLAISLALDNLFDRIKRTVPSETEYITKKSKRIFGDVSRIGRLINHVRSYSRNNQNQGVGFVSNSDIISSDFEVNTTIQNSLIIMGAQLQEHDFEIQLDLCPGLPMLFGNTYELEQVILNLLNNAKDALEERDKKETSNYRKTINIKTLVQGQNIIIEIKDNGTGIPESNKEKVLQPFFSTKGDRGVGVGLSISIGIINKFQGTLAIDSDGASYTLFRISLPIPS